MTCCFRCFFLFFNRKLTVSTAESDIPVFLLNLEQGESNANGVFAFKTASFVWEEEQVEAVVLIKQVSDIADARAPNKYTMSLLEDGTGVLVEEPSVPNFFIKQFDGLYEGYTKEHSMFAMHTTHAVCMTALLAAPERQTRKYIMKFPNGIKWKKGYMNTVNGNSLRGDVKLTKTSVKNGAYSMIEFSHFTIRFTAIVKPKERKFIRPEDSSSNVESLLSGMFSATKI